MKIERKAGENKIVIKSKITIYQNQKGGKLPLGMSRTVRKACLAVLSSENFPFPAEITVTFTDDAEIKKLNTQHRQIEKSTDVLSFPLGENGIYDTNPENNLKMLGDVVISVEHAMSQAKEYGHSLKREIAFLTVHSMLHLLGYDHVNGKEQETQMREKEETVLKKLGITRDKN